jgi:hypothetical protein
MAGVNLSVQDDALKALRRKLGDMEKRAPAVQAMALNQTQTVLKKYLPAEAQKQYTYKRKLKKPRQQRASARKLTAVLYYDRNDPGLNYFNFSRGKPGTPRNTRGERLAAKVKSDGSLKPITQAFAIKLSGEKIFRREEKVRLPISRVFGPSEHNMINHVWQGKAARQHTAKTMSEKLDTVINNEYLKKWGLKK